ncbi:acyltransferase family protein [Acinetobacter sp. WZC-1]|uniref:acyltransferase family protein n=1 Tax=Acinetobacter sp. WZC-1 TaxID=3459034 RepID=UPI00403D96AA
MGKINAAESIRGLACLAVVFSHLSLSFFPYLHHFEATDVANNALIYAIHHSPFAFWYSGTAAVYVFFVLSGFVLSYAILKDPAKVRNKISNMMVKRYPRLMIPALVSCVLTWLVFSLVKIDSGPVNSWLKIYITQDFTLKHAVYEGTIGSFFFAESDTNWVLWTMTIELLGSFALFLLIYLYQLKKILFLIGSVAVACLTWYWRGEGFSLGVLSFIAGIYIYLYGRRLSLSVAAPMLLFGLYLAGAHNSSESYGWIYRLMGERTYEYCNFFAGILIVYSILMSRQLSAQLDRKPLIWLGKLSFSVYLLHLLLIYLVCLPVFNALLAIGMHYVSAAVLASVLSILVMLLSADVYSRLVDQFAIDFSNRLAAFIIRKK